MDENGPKVKREAKKACRLPEQRVWNHSKTIVEQLAKAAGNTTDCLGGSTAISGNFWRHPSMKTRARASISGWKRDR